MRFILYNIRYGTGIKASSFIRSSRKNIDRIADFLRPLEPDLVGLVEVDYGSYRMGRKNQVELLAESLGHYLSYSCKYDKRSLWSRIPVLNRQGNGFLTRDRICNETFHYFDRGMKRLVIELELDHLVIYLVHLSLGGKARHRQLGTLYKLVKETKKPCIVAGDFNMLWGKREIELFLAATGLNNANKKGLPTYPSHNPARCLDFILCSEEIEIRDFQVPSVQLSDHLPLMIDFDVKVPLDRRVSARHQRRPAVLPAVEWP